MTTQIDLHGAEVIALPNQATPITVGPTSIVGLVGSAPDAAGEAAASLVIGALNAAVKATAAVAGAAGNATRVTFVVSGVGTALSVAYDATADLITVNVATNAITGVAESTATQIVAAWGAVAAVIAVATLALAAGSSGATVVGANAAANLIGGEDDPFPVDTPFLVNTSAIARRLGASGELVKAINDVWRTSGRFGAIIVGVKTADDLDASITGTLADRTGVYALLNAQSRTGYAPSLIGTTASKAAGVIGALEAIGGDLRAIPVVALDGADAAAAQTAAAGLGKVYAVWPNFVIADGSVETVRNASGLVLGHMVRTDRERNVAESPSNRRLSNVLRTEVDIDWHLESRTSTANILSRAFITTAVRRRRGLYLWGNRLADGELVTHRRVRYVVRQALLSYIVDWGDRNVDVPFVEFVLGRMNKFLRDRSLPGSRRLLTGGRAWFDPAENTTETLGANQVSFSYDLGLFNVAEHLRFIETVTGIYNERIIAELTGG